MAFDPVHGLVPGRFNRRQLILGRGTAMAIAAALAACGSDSKSTTPAATNAPSATEAPTGQELAGATTPAPSDTSAAATSAPATGAPKAGGIFHVGTKGNVNDIIDGPTHRGESRHHAPGHRVGAADGLAPTSCRSTPTAWPRMSPPRQPTTSLSR